jgi:CheY-like chemotaxis protein
MALRPVPDPAVVRGREMIDRQVTHLTRLVNDLLEVGRMIRWHVEVRKERLDLARLVRTAAEDQRPAAERAGLGLRVDVPELPVWVTGDATRLTQVLDNLLHNAVKFSDSGGSIGVRMAVTDGQAAIDVRDTGIGIEPGVLARLFEPFSQADRSLARSRGGLGLGLSLVRRLVELHGGTVGARSDGPGTGSTFTLRLPVEAEPAALTSTPLTPGPTGKRLRILVVEDNRDAADSLRMVLELYGYEVTVAYAGPDGVAAAVRWHPDVVLCDIGLPGLDGYGVAGALRGNPATARARLIAVTGYGHDEDRRRSKEAGFDTHLVKPVDPQALQEVLARATAA